MDVSDSDERLGQAGRQEATEGSSLTGSRLAVHDVSLRVWVVLCVVW
jgi:hypothetical protein